MGSNINTRKFLSRRYSGIYILTGGSLYNPDYTLVKNAIESTGVTLTPTQNNAGNTLVNQLQSYGLWSKQKALYGVLGGTAGAHKWNWKDPRDLDAAFRLSFSTGWTHASTGMTPSSAYADTFLNPTTAYSVDDNLHLSFYSRTNASTSNTCEIGCQTNSGTYNILSLRRGDNSNNTYYGINTISNFANFIDSNSAAFYIGTRTGTTINGFRNNIKAATATGAATTRTNVKIVIGANNHSTLGIIQYTLRQCAFASIGDGLTDTEAGNFYTAVQNYQTTLGRQV